VAAACLAIALRESNRPDCLRDIASLLKVPPTSISREFTSITTALKLSLSLVDPAVYISTLQTHLASILKEHDSDLPIALSKALRLLCLLSAANRAIALGQVLARLSPDLDVLRLPAPPTACGIFILALESENRGALNPLADLAECLGSRCHVAKGVVMTRYKIIQDEVASWVEKVPWLDKYESKKGRAKVSKRLIVARGLNDVIQFQEEIWQQKTMPIPDLELSDDESKTDDNEEAPLSVGSSQPRKRPRLNHALRQATRFLLDPLGTSISSPLSAPPNGTSQPSNHLSSQLPLAVYILANPASLIGRPPTRLQLLALDRGGANEDQIPDDELFADGEFEKMLRSDEEIQTLRETFGWKDDDIDQNDEASTSPNKGTRKTRTKRTLFGAEDEILQGSAFSPRKKSRLNMEALARFLAGDEIGRAHV